MIFKRRRGQQEMPPLLNRLNGLIAPLRPVMEHPFVRMKNMGCRRVCYRGRRRNEGDAGLDLTGCKRKRSPGLTRAA